MKPQKSNEKKHLFDNPRNVRWLRQLLYVLCVVVVFVDLVYQRKLTFKDGVFAAEGWFGFYAIYGLVTVILVVVLALGMRKLLKREEDYYD